MNSLITKRCSPIEEAIYQDGFQAGAASRDAEVVSLTNQRDYEYVRAENAERERDTAWAQAHRLALELECLIMDTKDNAVVSKWWDSAFEAIEEYQSLKPGADEESEAWAKMRKAGI